MNNGSTGLLSSQEAADLLGIQKDTLRHWKTKGVLCPRYTEEGGRRGEYYDPAEVAAFSEARTKGLKTESLRLVVSQAYATARTSQRRLDALEAALGLSSKTLSMRPEDVASLYADALKDSRRIINGKEKVAYWADKLFGVTDVYLKHTSEVVGVKDSWTPFMELSRQLRTHQDVEACTFDVEARLIYGRLHAACKQLTSQVFAYCVLVYGVRKAITTVPRDFMGEVHEIMLIATEG